MRGSTPRRRPLKRRDESKVAHSGAGAGVVEPPAPAEPGAPGSTAPCRLASRTRWAGRHVSGTTVPARRRRGSLHARLRAGLRWRRRCVRRVMLHCPACRARPTLRTRSWFSAIPLLSLPAFLPRPQFLSFSPYTPSSRRARIFPVPAPSPLRCRPAPTVRFDVITASISPPIAVRTFPILFLHPPFPRLRIPPSLLSLLPP